MNDVPVSPRPQLQRVILFPGAGRAVLVQNYNVATSSGSILVRITENEPLVVRVLASIGNVGDASPLPSTHPLGNPPPAGCFDLMNTGGTTWEKADAPVGGLPPSPVPVANNKKLFIGGYDGGDNLRTTQAVEFVAMPSEVHATVSARHCIWLVYAPPGSSVPQFNEAPTEEYLPRVLRVPDGAHQVRVEIAPGTWSWRHNPSAATASGPEGRPGTERHLEGPHVAKYKNAQLQSDHIISTSCRLNRLVALWEYDDPAIDTTEIDIFGNPTQLIPSGPQPYSLRLGCHDGYEWSNNEGEVAVKVFWLEAAPPPGSPIT